MKKNFVVVTLVVLFALLVIGTAYAGPAKSCKDALTELILATSSPPPPPPPPPPASPEAKG